MCAVHRRQAIEWLFSGAFFVSGFWIRPDKQAEHEVANQVHTALFL